jgi:hypothetical protein
MLFRSRRVTTAADYSRAMREQQGQKEARLPTLVASGGSISSPTCRSMSGQLDAGPR